MHCMWAFCVETRGCRLGPSRGEGYLNLITTISNGKRSSGFRPLAGSKVSERTLRLQGWGIVLSFRPLTGSKVSEQIFMPTLGELQ